MLTVLNGLFYRLRSLFRRKAVEGELDEELRFHLEQSVERYVNSGLSREEALRRARLEFGGIERAKEECRDARGVNLIESLIQDVRFGLRMLAKNTGFTAAAVLAIALGIGINVGIFSVLNGVALREPRISGASELNNIHRILTGVG